MFRKACTCLTALIIVAAISEPSAQCNTVDAITSASFKITGGEACETYANLNWTFKEKNGTLTIEWGTSTAYGTSKSVYSANPVNLPDLKADTKYYYHVWGVYQGKTHQYTTSSFTTSGGAAANNPPVITSASEVTCTTGTTKTYTITATDQDNDPVTFTISGKPSWISFATPVLTLKPVSGSSNATVTIVAADGKSGTDTLKLTVTVVAASTSVLAVAPAATNRTFRFGASRVAVPHTTDPCITVSLFSLNGTAVMQQILPIDALDRLTAPESIIPGMYLLQLKNSTVTSMHAVTIRK